MSRIARLRPVLAAIAAALFVIGLIGLATVNGGSSNGSRIRSAEATASTVATGSEDPTAASPDVAGGTAPGGPAAGGTTASVPTTPTTAGGPATTRAGAAPAATGPAAPPTAAPAAVARPPRPGDYRYTGQSGDSGSGGFTVKVEADGEGGGVTHQVISIPQGGANFRNNAAWSNKQLTFERSELSQGGASYSCDWQPATTEYAFPLAVGNTWSMDSTCSASAIGQSFTIHRVEHSEVTGVATVTVGGTPVATWVIERTTTVTFTSATGKGTSDSKTTEQFAPDRGLFVHRHVDSTQTGSDGTGQPSSSDVSLVSLDPA